MRGKEGTYTNKGEERFFPFIRASDDWNSPESNLPLLLHVHTPLVSPFKGTKNVRLHNFGDPLSPKCSQLSLCFPFSVVPAFRFSNLSDHC